MDRPGGLLLRVCVLMYASCTWAVAMAASGAAADAKGVQTSPEAIAAPIGDDRPEEGRSPETAPLPGDERYPESAAGPSDSTGRYLTRSKSSVYFARGSAELSAEALATISDNAERLKANSDAAVTLVGFTENLASSSYSLALAQQRTKVVSEALLNMGVAARQIRSAAYGREDPGVAPCSTEVCRISYRRVEFRYLKPTDAKPERANVGPRHGQMHRRGD